MRERWDRTGIVTRLLMAIFGNLSRRAWWAYHARTAWPAPTRAAVVMRRPAERATFVPQVTAAWESVAAGALPVAAAALTVDGEGPALPVLWIDAAERPDIADLPRVLQANPDPPVVATQWLADLGAGRGLLVVTFVEPVAATWALTFPLPAAGALLEQIAAAGGLVIALDPAPPVGLGSFLPTVPQPRRSRSICLPIASTTQLHALLERWRGAQR